MLKSVISAMEEPENKQENEEENEKAADPKKEKE